MAILNRFSAVFFFTAIRLDFWLLAAEFLAIPARDSGNRAIRDSRFCATKYRTEEHCRPQNRPKIGEKVTKNRILALCHLFLSLST